MTAFLDVAAEVAALAESSGHQDLADQVRAESRRPGTDAITVIVVGEQKRGKSSFVNALVGRDGLLPVDVDVATSCYLVVQYGAVERVLVRSDDAPDGIEIPAADIAEYASVEGNLDPSDDGLLHEGVRSVEISVDDPLLQHGITIVDTPGVGGLDAGHTEITLATLRRADALLFVIDPNAPLKETELRFLRAATERIRTVAFVLTKIGIHRGWEQQLDANHALLAEHAPRYADAPWFPVDSVTEIDAIAAGATQRAAELRDRSGFVKIIGYLTDLAAHAAQVRDANLAASARSAVGVMRDARIRERRALAGDPALHAELATQQQQLIELSRAGAGWQSDLAGGLRRVELAAQREVQRRLRELRRRAEDAVAGWRPGLLTELPRDLDEGLRGVWLDVSGAVQDAVAAVYGALARELQVAGTDALAGEFPYPEQLESLPPLTKRAADDGPSAIESYLPVVDNATSFLGKFGQAVATAHPGALLASLCFGFFVRNRDRERRQRLGAQRDAGRFITRAIEDASQEMVQELRVRIAEAEESILHHVRDRMQARQSELEQAVAAAAGQLRTSQAERAPALHAVDERIARLRELDEALAAGTGGPR